MQRSRTAWRVSSRSDWWLCSWRYPVCYLARSLPVLTNRRHWYSREGEIHYIWQHPTLLTRISMGPRMVWLLVVDKSRIGATGMGPLRNESHSGSGMLDQNRSQPCQPTGRVHQVRDKLRLLRSMDWNRCGRSCIRPWITHWMWCSERV
jgi:hypothetical protein